LDSPAHLCEVWIGGVEASFPGLEDNAADVAIFDTQTQIDHQRQDFLRNVGVDQLFAGLGNLPGPSQHVARVGLLDDRVDYAALPVHPREVVGAIAAAGIPEGATPVELLIGSRLEK